MATREREYTIDANVWRLACSPENESYHYTLIDGELTVSMSPGLSYMQGMRVRLTRLMGNFVMSSATWAT